MKLNLGSGYSGDDALHIITGGLRHDEWIFVEVCDLPHYRAAASRAGRFDCYDFTDGIREPDNSIEVIWMGDVLEHVWKWRTVDVLRDCFRVLKPGGQILISVPDMARVMSRWLAGDAMDECADLIWGQQDARDRKNCGPDSHHNGFRESTLRQLLASAGFVDIRRVSFHNTWFELAIVAKKPAVLEVQK